MKIEPPGNIKSFSSNVKTLTFKELQKLKQYIIDTYSTKMYMCSQKDNIVFKTREEIFKLKLGDEKYNILEFIFNFDKNKKLGGIFFFNSDNFSYISSEINVLSLKKMVRPASGEEPFNINKNYSLSELFYLNDETITKIVNFTDFGDYQLSYEYIIKNGEASYLFDFDNYKNYTYELSSYKQVKNNCFENHFSNYERPFYLLFSDNITETEKTYVYNEIHYSGELNDKYLLSKSETESSASSLLNKLIGSASNSLAGASSNSNKGSNSKVTSNSIVTTPAPISDLSKEITTTTTTTSAPSLPDPNEDQEYLDEKIFFYNIKSSYDIQNLFDSLNRIIILNMNEDNICQTTSNELVIKTADSENMLQPNLEELVEGNYKDCIDYIANTNKLHTSLFYRNSHPKLFFNKDGKCLVPSKNNANNIGFSNHIEKTSYKMCNFDKGFPSIISYNYLVNGNINKYDYVRLYSDVKVGKKTDIAKVLYTKNGKALIKHQFTPSFDSILKIEETDNIVNSFEIDPIYYGEKIDLNYLRKIKVKISIVTLSGQRKYLINNKGILEIGECNSSETNCIWRIEKIDKNNFMIKLDHRHNNLSKKLYLEYSDSKVLDKKGAIYPSIHYFTITEYRDQFYISKYDTVKKKNVMISVIESEGFQDFTTPETTISIPIVNHL